MIWEAKDLSWQDKALLAEISFLDDGTGCRASRSYLSRLFGTSPDAIKQRLSRLRSQGYIIDRGFDGVCWKVSVKHNPSGIVETNDSSNMHDMSAVTPVLPLISSQGSLNEEVSSKNSPGGTRRDKKDSSELIRINSSESCDTSQEKAKMKKEDLVRLVAVWKESTNGGLVGYGVLGRAVRGLVAEHGAEEVANALKRYLASEKTTGWRYASPSGFASKFGAFRSLPEGGQSWAGKMGKA